MKPSNLKIPKYFYNGKLIVDENNAPVHPVGDHRLVFKAGKKNDWRVFGLF